MLGVLPFGTMNLLARDLGMPTDPQAAVAALAAAVPRRIDLAEINGRPFHTLSGLGFFSHMARAREEVRGHPLGRLAGVLLAWFRALRRTAPFSIDIVVDGQARAGHGARRARHQQPLRLRLAPAAARRGRARNAHRRGSGHAHQAESLAPRCSPASWREEPAIRHIVARDITVASARRHTHASTDGELVRERLPLRYRVLPAALTVLSADAGRSRG